MKPTLIIFYLLLFLGCGREVSISNEKLEKFSSIMQPEAENLTQTGTLVRGEGDQIIAETKTYTVSRFSSHLALTFIDSFPKGSRINVKFKGVVRASEIVLTRIE